MIELKCKINVSVKKPKPKPKLEKPADAPTIKRRGKIPRISRLMALAIRMDEMLRHGEAQDTFDLAELGKVSQPRITQILSLSLLAPEIQEALLRLPRETSGKPAIHERNIRPITKEPMWDEQRVMWRNLLKRVNASLDVDV
ncbi:hypothetical protein [Crateriforma spongiae]|uniref:hypothetical protein n=1 Tax=Crateriforma spongiae TaxID=2724528 RepID=UPI0039B0BB32